MLYTVCAVLAVGLLVFDQWLKHWIILNLPLGESLPLFPGFVELHPRFLLTGNLGRLRVCRCPRCIWNGFER